MVPHLTFRYTSKILFVRAYVQVAFQSMQTHFKIEKKKKFRNIQYNRYIEKSVKIEREKRKRGGREKDRSRNLTS